jgi:acetylornithine deacetylase
MGGPEDGERNVAKYIADFFRAARFAGGDARGSSGRPNVVGRLLRGDELPWLVIEGHLDTVPAPPELIPQITEGRLVGRGACDMKGGIAAALHAIEYLSGLDDLPLNISVVGAIDEEFAYRGVLAYLEHVGRRGRRRSSPSLPPCIR